MKMFLIIKRGKQVHNIVMGAKILLWGYKLSIDLEEMLSDLKKGFGIRDEQWIIMNSVFTCVDNLLFDFLTGAKGNSCNMPNSLSSDNAYIIAKYLIEHQFCGRTDKSCKVHKK